MNEIEFNELVQACLPRLRNIIRKQIGHPEQCEDVLQEALTKAWLNRASFRNESTFATWISSIAIHTGLDYLRSQKQWRSKVQEIYAAMCLENPEWGMEVGQMMANPEVSYEVDEHIAYCFSCIGRSLIPLDQAALILKEVLGLTNMEGAKVLGLTQSVFRQHLTAARTQMQKQYEQLCALVNKAGTCYQCKGLRDGFPESRKGSQELLQIDEPLSFELRMKIVEHANLDSGKTQLLHEIFWKRSKQIEDQQLGNESLTTDCGI